MPAHRFAGRIAIVVAISGLVELQLEQEIGARTEARRQVGERRPREPLAADLRRRAGRAAAQHRRVAQAERRHGAAPRLDAAALHHPEGIDRGVSRYGRRHVRLPSTRQPAAGTRNLALSLIQDKLPAARRMAPATAVRRMPIACEASTALALLLPLYGEKSLPPT